MSAQHQDLAGEFPEFREMIQELRTSNLEFARLLRAYVETDQELQRIADQIETPSDAYTESLKLKRLQLKDRLYAMLQAREHGA